MVRVVDSDIRERVRIALQASPLHAIRNLEVEGGEDQVVIRGRVPSFYYKQVAQELVLSAVKDLVVVNEVEVDGP